MEILDHLREIGTTVIVSTHDLNLASKKFEQVILLNRRLIAIGPPAQVMRKEIVREAFGGGAFDLGDMLVVDQCCPE